MYELVQVMLRFSKPFLAFFGIRFSQGLGRRFTMAEPQKGCSQWHRRRSSEQKEELTVRFCAILDHLERAIRASRHVYSSRAGWLGPALGRALRSRLPAQTVELSSTRWALLMD